MKVIIAHTETRGPLGDSHLGEVRMGTPPLAGPWACLRVAPSSFFVMNCVHCSPAAVTQGCKEGNGLFEGENSLLSGPLS